jgi:tetratricopeptide (TPR) repeat protein
MQAIRASRLRDTAKGLLVSVVTIVALAMVLEIVLRLIGYGDPYQRRDLFYGFEGTNRMFQKREVPGKGKFYVQSPNKIEGKDPQSFPVHKSENTYRIFTFGGSTTWGEPWGPDGSFSYWLQHDLKLLYPDIEIEVINTGMKGWGSTRVLQILNEAVDYNPDLFIVYTGHNEFRDARFHPQEIMRPPFQSKLLKLAFSSRAVYLLYERSLRLKEEFLGRRITSYAEEFIEHLLSKPFTIDMFASHEYYRVPNLLKSQENISDADPCKQSEIKPSDDSTQGGKSLLKGFLGCKGWRSFEGAFASPDISAEEIYARFKSNIEQMIQVSQENGVPIFFLAKAENTKSINSLRDYFISSMFLREDSEEQWKIHYDNGTQNMKNGRYKEALQDFEAVKRFYKPSFVDADPLLQLYIGECYEKLGFYEKARVEYAKRLSTMHLLFNEILKDVSSQYNIPVLDVQLTLARMAENGIVGYENYFVDAIHMTINGYRLIGRTLATILPLEDYIENDTSHKPLSEAISPVEVDIETELPDRFMTEEVLTSLGWSAFHQGKIKEAIEKGQMAVNLDPYAIQAHLVLGYAYAKMQREKDAYAEWKTLKEIRIGKTE